MGQFIISQGTRSVRLHTTASVDSAVYDVVKSLQKKNEIARFEYFRFTISSANPDDLFFENGMIVNRKSHKKLTYTELLTQNQLSRPEVTADSKSGSEKEQFSGKSFCAHFVKVLVHPATGAVKVNRVVTAVDAGKIINHKTATSQVYGSVVWEIGIALMEEGIVDQRSGSYVNTDPADYHVPVNADIPDIGAIFIDKPDPILSPIGVKGLGEIGLVGFSVAVANAVYHATGKRIISLPITSDKLIDNSL
jgi:xanthine dehydrogenase YagR molybdenum-binding subunit